MEFEAKNLSTISIGTNNLNIYSYFVNGGLNSVYAVGYFNSIYDELALNNIFIFIHNMGISIKVLTKVDGDIVINDLV